MFLNGKRYNDGYGSPLFYSLESQVSAMQRRKGASGERELFGLLRDELGVVVERNLSQTRGGGADSLSIDGLAIEVKRQEHPVSEAWWTQAVQQAGSSRVPVVAYRRSRQPWRFVVPLAWIRGRDVFHERMRATLDLREFCFLVREGLPQGGVGSGEGEVSKAEIPTAE